WRQLAEQRAGQRVVDDVGRQRLADRPLLPRLARRQAAIVLLGQARRTVTGGIFVAVVVVHSVAIVVGDGDGGALSLALTASLALTLSLAGRRTAAFVGPVTVSLRRRRQSKRE